jgi:hypothetical protein
VTLAVDAAEAAFAFTQAHTSVRSPDTTSKALTLRNHASGSQTGQAAASNGSQASTSRTTLLQPASETTENE